jgi:hypothetical protein
LALAKFMRLSLMKAAHSVVSRRNVQEIGAATLWSQVVKTADYQEDALSVPQLFADI